MFKRITAFLTLFTFLVANLTPAPVIASPEGAKQSQSEIASTLLGMSFRNDVSEFGTVRRLFINKEEKALPKRFVVYIHDAHADLQAQKNIQQLIAYFQKELGIQTILAEGAAGEADLSKLRNFSDKNLTTEVAGQFLKTAEITGFEYAAITSKESMRLIGLEDPSAYEEHLKAYAENQEVLGQNQKIISNALQKIAEEKKKVFNKRLYEFDRTILHTIPYLARRARELGMDLEPFHSVRTFLRMQVIEGILNLPWRTPEKTDRDRYVRKLNELQESLNSSQLFQECEQLKALMKEALFRNAAERELAQRADFTDLLSKLVELKLDPQDWERYVMTSRNVILSAAKNLENGASLKRSPAEKFYRCALVRDRKLAEHLLHELAHTDRAFLITGGFHGPALEEALEKAGISFISIYPGVSEAPNLRRYAERMTNDAKALTAAPTLGPAFFSEHTLMPPLLTFSPDFQEQFIEMRTALTQKQTVGLGATGFGSKREPESMSAAQAEELRTYLFQMGTWEDWREQFLLLREFLASGVHQRLFDELPSKVSRPDAQTFLSKHIPLKNNGALLQDIHAYLFFPMLPERALVEWDYQSLLAPHAHLSDALINILGLDYFRDRKPIEITTDPDSMIAVRMKNPQHAKKVVEIIDTVMSEVEMKWAQEEKNVWDEKKDTARDELIHLYRTNRSLFNELRFTLNHGVHPRISDETGIHSVEDALKIVSPGDKQKFNSVLKRYYGIRRAIEDYFLQHIFFPKQYVDSKGKARGDYSPAVFSASLKSILGLSGKKDRWFDVKLENGLFGMATKVAAVQFPANVRRLAGLFNTLEQEFSQGYQERVHFEERARLRNALIAMGKQPGGENNFDQLGQMLAYGVHFEVQRQLPERVYSNSEMGDRGARNYIFAQMDSRDRAVTFGLDDRLREKALAEHMQTFLFFPALNSTQTVTVDDFVKKMASDASVAEQIMNALGIDLVNRHPATVNIVIEKEQILGGIFSIPVSRQKIKTTHSITVIGVKMQKPQFLTDVLRVMNEARRELAEQKEEEEARVWDENEDAIRKVLEDLSYSNARLFDDMFETIRHGMHPDFYRELGIGDKRHMLDTIAESDRPLLGTDPKMTNFLFFPPTPAPLKQTHSMYYDLLDKSLRAVLGIRADRTHRFSVGLVSSQQQIMQVDVLRVEHSNNRDRLIDLFREYGAGFGTAPTDRRGSGTEWDAEKVRHLSPAKLLRRIDWNPVGKGRREGDTDRRKKTLEFLLGYFKGDMGTFWRLMDNKDHRIPEDAMASFRLAHGIVDGVPHSMEDISAMLFRENITKRKLEKTIIRKQKVPSAVEKLFIAAAGGPEAAYRELLRVPSERLPTELDSLLKKLETSQVLTKTALGTVRPKDREEMDRRVMEIIRRLPGRLREFVKARPEGRAKFTARLRRESIVTAPDQYLSESNPNIPSILIVAAFAREMGKSIDGLLGTEEYRAQSTKSITALAKKQPAERGKYLSQISGLSRTEQEKLSGLHVETFMRFEKKGGSVRTLEKFLRLSFTYGISPGQLMGSVRTGDFERESQPVERVFRAGGIEVNGTPVNNGANHFDNDYATTLVRLKPGSPIALSTLPGQAVTFTPKQLTKFRHIYVDRLLHGASVEKLVLEIETKTYKTIVKETKQIHVHAEAFRYGNGDQKDHWSEELKPAKTPWKGDFLKSFEVVWSDADLSLTVRQKDSSAKVYFSVVLLENESAPAMDRASRGFGVGSQSEESSSEPSAEGGAEQSDSPPLVKHRKKITRFDIDVTVNYIIQLFNDDSDRESFPTQRELSTLGPSQQTFSNHMPGILTALKARIEKKDIDEALKKRLTQAVHVYEDDLNERAPRMPFNLDATVSHIIQLFNDDSDRIRFPTQQELSTLGPSQATFSYHMPGILTALKARIEKKDIDEALKKRLTQAINDYENALSERVPRTPFNLDATVSHIIQLFNDDSDHENFPTQRELSTLGPSQPTFSNHMPGILTALKARIEKKDIDEALKKRLTQAINDYENVLSERAPRTPFNLDAAVSHIIQLFQDDPDRIHFPILRELSTLGPSRPTFSDHMPGILTALKARIEKEDIDEALRGRILSAMVDRLIRAERALDRLSTAATMPLDGGDMRGEWYKKRFVVGRSRSGDPSAVLDPTLLRNISRVWEAIADLDPPAQKHMYFLLDLLDRGQPPKDWLKAAAEELAVKQDELQASIDAFRTALERHIEGRDEQSGFGAVDWSREDLRGWFVNHIPDGQTLVAQDSFGEREAGILEILNRTESINQKTRALTEHFRSMGILKPGSYVTELIKAKRASDENEGAGLKHAGDLPQIDPHIGIPIAPNVFLISKDLLLTYQLLSIRAAEISEILSSGTNELEVVASIVRLIEAEKPVGGMVVKSHADVERLVDVLFLVAAITKSESLAWYQDNAELLSNQLKFLMRRRTALFALEVLPQMTKNEIRLTVAHELLHVLLDTHVEHMPTATRRAYLRRVKTPVRNLIKTTKKADLKGYEFLLDSTANVQDIYEEMIIQSIFPSGKAYRGLREDGTIEFHPEIGQDAISNFTERENSVYEYEPWARKLRTQAVEQANALVPKFREILSGQQEKPAGIGARLRGWISSFRSSGFGTQDIKSFQDIRKAGTHYGIDQSGFVFSNEEKRVEAIEKLKSFAGLGSGIHFGIGGWFNLDIIAARRSPYAVLMDKNTWMGKMYEMLKSSILDETILDASKPVSERRKQFAFLFAEKIIQNGVYVSTDSTRAGVELFYSELGERFRAKESWLSNDDAFLYIQRLFQEGRVIFVTLDVTEVETFRSISTWMKQEGLRADTLYMSNVFQWLSKEDGAEKISTNEVIKSQRRFVESLSLLADPRTVLIEAYPGANVNILLFNETQLQGRIFDISEPSSDQTVFSAATWDEAALRDWFTEHIPNGAKIIETTGFREHAPQIIAALNDGSASINKKTKALASHFAALGISKPGKLISDLLKFEPPIQIDPRIATSVPETNIFLLSDEVFWIADSLLHLEDDVDPISFAKGSYGTLSEAMERRQRSYAFVLRIVSEKHRQRYVHNVLKILLELAHETGFMDSTGLLQRREEVFKQLASILRSGNIFLPRSEVSTWDDGELRGSLGHEFFHIAWMAWKRELRQSGGRNGDVYQKIVRWYDTNRKEIAEILGEAGYAELQNRSVLARTEELVAQVLFPSDGFGRRFRADGTIELIETGDAEEDSYAKSAIQARNHGVEVLWDEVPEMRELFYSVLKQTNAALPKVREAMQLKSGFGAETSMPELEPWKNELAERIRPIIYEIENAPDEAAHVGAIVKLRELLEFFSFEEITPEMAGLVKTGAVLLEIPQIGTSVSDPPALWLVSHVGDHPLTGVGLVELISATDPEAPILNRDLGDFGEDGSRLKREDESPFTRFYVLQPASARRKPGEISARELIKPSVQAPTLLRLPAEDPESEWRRLYRQRSLEREPPLRLVRKTGEVIDSHGVSSESGSVKQPIGDDALLLDVYKIFESIWSEVPETPRKMSLRFRWGIRRWLWRIRREFKSNRQGLLHLMRQTMGVFDHSSPEAESKDNWIRWVRWFGWAGEARKIDPELAVASIRGLFDSVFIKKPVDQELLAEALRADSGVRILKTALALSLIGSYDSSIEIHTDLDLRQADLMAGNPFNELITLVVGSLPGPDWEMVNKLRSGFGVATEWDTAALRTWFVEHIQDGTGIIETDGFRERAPQISAVLNDGSASINKKTKAVVPHFVALGISSKPDKLISDLLKAEPPIQLDPRIAVHVPGTRIFLLSKEVWLPMDLFDSDAKLKDAQDLEEFISQSFVEAVRRQESGNSIAGILRSSNAPPEFFYYFILRAAKVLNSEHLDWFRTQEPAILKQLSVVLRKGNIIFPLKSILEQTNGSRRSNLAHEVFHAKLKKYIARSDTESRNALIKVTEQAMAQGPLFAFIVEKGYEDLPALETGDLHRIEEFLAQTFFSAEIDSLGNVTATAISKPGDKATKAFSYQRQELMDLLFELSPDLKNIYMESLKEANDLLVKLNKTLTGASKGFGAASIIIPDAGAAIRDGEITAEAILKTAKENPRTRIHLIFSEMESWEHAAEFIEMAFGEKAREIFPLVSIHTAETIRAQTKLSVSAKPERLKRAILDRLIVNSKGNAVVIEGVGAPLVGARIGQGQALPLQIRHGNENIRYLLIKPQTGQAHPNLLSKAVVLSRWNGAERIDELAVRGLKRLDENRWLDIETDRVTQEIFAQIERAKSFDIAA